MNIGGILDHVHPKRAGHYWRDQNTMIFVESLDTFTNQNFVVWERTLLVYFPAVALEKCYCIVLEIGFCYKPPSFLFLSPERQIFSLDYWSIFFFFLLYFTLTHYWAHWHRPTHGGMQAPNGTPSHLPPAYLQYHHAPQLQACCVLHWDIDHI